MKNIINRTHKLVAFSATETYTFNFVKCCLKFLLDNTAVAEKTRKNSEINC